MNKPAKQGSTREEEHRATPTSAKGEAQRTAARGGKNGEHKIIHGAIKNNTNSRTKVCNSEGVQIYTITCGKEDLETKQGNIYTIAPIALSRIFGEEEDIMKIESQLKTSKKF